MYVVCRYTKQIISLNIYTYVQQQHYYLYNVYTCFIHYWNIKSSKHYFCTFHSIQCVGVLIELILSWLRVFLQAQEDKQKPQVVKAVSRLDECQLVVVPWRKPKPELSEHASTKDRLLVCEGIEGELPVVPPKPAFTNPTKWNCVCRIL